MKTTTICFLVLVLTAWLPAFADGPRPLLVTIDDLPLSAAATLHPDPDDRARVTEELLAVLARHQIRAVGLVTWQNVLADSDLKLLERWLEAGHELGNHSFHHFDYTRTAADDYVADVEAAGRQLDGFLAAHGRTLRFFRFPFLREGDTPAKLEAMRVYLGESGQRNLPVTIDDQDWSFARPWLEARRRGDDAEVTRVAEACCAEYHDDAVFVSPSGVTRGRQAVLDRYRRRYPDRAAQGELTIEILELETIDGTEVSMLGDARPGRVHAATVVGRWTLRYPGDAAPETATGSTLIVFQRDATAGERKIVRDASM